MHHSRVMLVMLVLLAMLPKELMRVMQLMLAMLAMLVSLDWERRTAPSVRLIIRSRHPATTDFSCSSCLGDATTNTCSHILGQNQWYHFGVGAPPILEPILAGIGMFTGTGERPLVTLWQDSRNSPLKPASSMVALLVASLPPARR